MIIKIRKYVATVAQFIEHDDGTITKETKDITLKGQRFSETSVWKQIPHDAKLVSHGYKEVAYEIDADRLEDFCKANGKPAAKGEDK